MKSVGDKIRVYRAERRMTQKALSVATGIPEITLRGYESNKFVPKIDKINKIAEALNVSVENLTSGTSSWRGADGHIHIKIPTVLDENKLKDLKRQVKEDMKFLNKVKYDEILKMFESLNELGVSRLYDYLSYMKSNPENINDIEFDTDDE
ncbi:hypothetical protein FACS1894188_05220 [Clostridia bacterium]|nr:hypothetical protein FACS1894188_05220 [Clostridia bacterium]